MNRAEVFIIEMVAVVIAMLIKGGLLLRFLYPPFSLGRLVLWPQWGGGGGTIWNRRTGERFACHSPGADLLGEQMREKVWWYLGRASKGLLVGFLPLLFLLASCGGGGGGSGGSGSGGAGQGSLSVELALTPGDGMVTVDLVEKGPLVRLLNISTYQLTAIDSDDEMNRVEGARLAEEMFNGSTLRGLTNDHNYTFVLRVFYFPLGLAELSNLSLRIDYADANAKNIRDARGITIGSNRDSDYLADLVDSDDDNDGVNDLDANGMALDECPRGELGWRSNRTTDIDGDGCRDEGEDGDDDNDRVNDVLDDCPRGEQGWRSNGTTDNDGDGCRDAGEDLDDDNDNIPDSEDLGEFNGEPCRTKPDCDYDTIADTLDVDIDGDGLIEIGMAVELDAVRWVLDGSGRRRSEGATLNQTGCGNGTTGGDITECSGYELVRDISLAAYAEGWTPLGRDVNSSTSGCQGTAFSGVFEGNGWTVKDLNISRGGEDCIGLFGHLAAGTVIRNLTVRVEAVIGRDRVGGLVGSANDDVRIVSSSSVAGEVSGGTYVGGLVGSGGDAEIVSSYSVVGVVSGSGSDVGGLVGSGGDAEIVSSYSVVGAVSGGSLVGGLVGGGEGAEIVSSYSVADEVNGGSNYVGGLVGWGRLAKIVSSSSVAGEVSGVALAVGGLVGWGWDAEIVSSSSVVGEVSGGSLVGGLVGTGGSVNSSYWHSAVSVVDNGKGESKTLVDLRTPTNDNAYDASSIYTNWANGANIDDETGVEDITIYCDENLNGAIEAAERRDGSGAGEDDNRIWDFGGTEDYPAIRCAPGELDEQRSWWFINTTTNRPQLDRSRLDALLP